VAFLDPSFDRAARAAAAEAQPRFTPLERVAIRIGAEDCVSSLGRHPTWLRVKRLVFGFKSSTPLSNPRLEAIRRLVVELRHARRGRVGELVLAAIRDGVTPEQAGALARRFRPRRRRWRLP
jgi:hypothetical protein